MPRWVHPDDVRAIRRYRRHGYTITALAQRFKLSRQAVSDIIHRKTHRNVTDNDAVPALSDVHVNTPRLNPPSLADIARQISERRATR